MKENMWHGHGKACVKVCVWAYAYATTHVLGGRAPLCKYRAAAGRQRLRFLRRATPSPRHVLDDLWHGHVCRHVIDVCIDMFVGRAPNALSARTTRAMRRQGGSRCSSRCCWAWPIQPRLYTFLYICLYTCLYTCPYTCLCIFLCTGLWTCPYAWLGMIMNVSIHMPVHISTHMPIHVSIHMSMHKSIHMSMHMAYTYLCTCLCTGSEAAGAHCRG